MFSMWKTLTQNPKPNPLPKPPVPTPVPSPPKLDPKGYFDIERHMFSMWKTLETQSPPWTPSPHPPQVRP